MMLTVYLLKVIVKFLVNSKLMAKQSHGRFVCQDVTSVWVFSRNFLMSWGISALNLTNLAVDSFQKLW